MSCGTILNDERSVGVKQGEGTRLSAITSLCSRPILMAAFCRDSVQVTVYLPRHAKSHRVFSSYAPSHRHQSRRLKTRSCQPMKTGRSLLPRFCIPQRIMRQRLLLVMGIIFPPTSLLEQLTPIPPRPRIVEACLFFPFACCWTRHHR